MSKKRSWTKEQLEKAVESSVSYRQALQKLGLREAGGNYAQIKKYIKEFNFDASHFKGKGWSRGLTGIERPKIPLNKILVKNSSYQGYKLKKRLLAKGVKPEHCEKCGWAKQTSEGHLPLELHHVNGDRHDHRLENLQVLCPNCHSLEPNYRSRKRK